MKLSKRIQSAFEKDPMQELAQQLFSEGYDEKIFMQEIKSEPKIIVSEVAIVKVRNYLRDLYTAAKYA